MEDYNIEIDTNLGENEKRIKEKEDEDFLIDEFLCSNTHHACFCDLIREEVKVTKKEAKENAEKLNNQLLE